MAHIDFNDSVDCHSPVNHSYCDQLTSVFGSQPWHEHYFTLAAATRAPLLPQAPSNGLDPQAALHGLTEWMAELLSVQAPRPGLTALRVHSAVLMLRAAMTQYANLIASTRTKALASNTIDGMINLRLQCLAACTALARLVSLFYLLPADLRTSHEDGVWMVQSSMCLEELDEYFQHVQEGIAHDIAHKAATSAVQLCRAEVNKHNELDRIVDARDPASATSSWIGVWLMFAFLQTAVQSLCLTDDRFSSRRPDCDCQRHPTRATRYVSPGRSHCCLPHKPPHRKAASALGSWACGGRNLYQANRCALRGIHAG